MVGPSTRRALNSRALRVADWLHYSAENLGKEIGCDTKELVRQIGLDSGAIRTRTKDGQPAMVTLKEDHLLNLILQMLRQEAELRRFAEPPRTKLRRL
jgi:hypothetical protein